MEKIVLLFLIAVGFVATGGLVASLITWLIDVRGREGFWREFWFRKLF